jgi:flagellar motor switch protein FliN/FliY
MPEERPEDESGSLPSDGSPPEDLAGADSPESDDSDEAAAALRAAKEALASIQAEADAAASGASAQAQEPEADLDQSSVDDIVNAAMRDAGGGGQTMADDVVNAALKAAMGGAKRLELPDFDLSSVAGAQHGLNLLADVQLDVRIELGRTRMLVEDVLRLNSGAVVELDRLAGDPLDVYVNDRLVARGEVLVLNDNFCIRVNEIVDSIGEPESGS